MSAKPEGAGSIWNVNSWHWENKNYTKPAKQLITEMLKGSRLSKGGLEITVTDVKNIEGDADVNIRKGKQILVFDFSINVEFLSEKDEHEVAGSFSLKEFNGDDLGDLELDNVTLKDKSEIGEGTKELLRKEGLAFYRGVLKDFREDLAKFESDPEKLAKDRAAREEATKATQKARLEKGAEKERLLE
jgi:activator of HSP90 ATPase